MNSAGPRSWRRFTPSWLLLVPVVLLAVPCHVTAQTAEEIVNGAILKYEAAALPDAIALFDKAIIQLEANRADSRARELLIKAYQFRARARLGVGDSSAAGADILALLQLQPGFKLPDEVSESLRSLFTQVRKTVIGDRLIVVVPSDAQVEIDGQAVRDLGQTIAFTSGKHRLSARRPGYTSVVDREFEVEPGSAQELTLPLARNSATVAVVTSPIGVEVFVDGVSRGVTESSDSGTNLSAPKLISDLDIRAHSFEFVLPCFKKDTRTINIDKFEDRTLPPVKLEPATATVTVDSATPGVMVFIDNVSRGQAPMTLPDVCEGKHTVELRSPHGRHLQRVDLKPGDRKIISGALYPAFALVSNSGGVQGLRGAGDIREEVEARLREVQGFTLYAPPLQAAQEALRSRDLSQEWLAFDRQGIPIGDAKRLTPRLRVQLSTELARTFEAQGVASVTIPSGVGSEPSELLLSLLAAGSSEPDILPVRLDDAGSLRSTIDRLDVSFPVFRPSLRMLAVDVTGPNGTHIIAASVDDEVRQAGLLPGARIVAVNGKKMADVAALNDLLATLDPKAIVNLDVLHGITPKKVDLPLRQQARAINLGDQTLLFNPLLMHLRHALAFAANTPAEQVIRLNIGIALMRLGNWEDARLQLESTTLPEGAGVSRGTVQYHLATCYEKLGRFGDAAKAWQSAKESVAWLTEDGPPVKGLAESKASGTK